MAVLLAFIILLTLAAVGAYLTNPFNRLTIIKRPYVVAKRGGRLYALDRTRHLRVRQERFWRLFAVLKSGLHILASRYLYKRNSKAKTLRGIIAGIHAYRYNSRKLLLISGDHFNSLFVRNLGVFYYPMLDRTISNTKAKWHNRQVVYLQTLAYALGVYSQRPIPTTTIVPTGPYQATCVNFYAYPSDTVYGLLYAFSALVGKEKAAATTYGQPCHELQTIELANELLDQHRVTLRKLYEHYRHTVYDEAEGLIKRDLHLSGAKDITRRNCSFYDNVIFWKTTSLAMGLGIIPPDAAFLATLKRRILKTFWLKEPGYFLEDLSEQGIKEQFYSSDWLIVLATGFLRPGRQSERRYFERSVAHIERHAIDRPFPLRYHTDRRRHRQFLAVRLAVASYGGDAIWSFWGMEYIKVLLLLSQYSPNNTHLRRADEHIATYKQLMVRDGGFPEVFSPKGELLQTPLYRSIRQTGWVIGFEQVVTMRDAIKS